MSRISLKHKQNQPITTITFLILIPGNVPNVRIADLLNGEKKSQLLDAVSNA
jgi:hypothetical protein